MRLLAALLLGSAGSQCPPTHPCTGGAHITTNILKGLPPLSKPHYSWPIPTNYLANTSVSGGVLVDYGTGRPLPRTPSLPLSLLADPALACAAAQSASPAASRTTPPTRTSAPWQ